MQKKVIALATGGTGGHIFPAIATAEELEARNYKVIFLVDKRFSKIAPIDNIKNFEIPSVSSANVGILGILRKIFVLTLGIAKSIILLKKHNVNLVIGYGGYPSLPPCLASLILRIPYFIHEQNSILGKANALLGKKAKFIATSFEEIYDLDQINTSKIVFTGNPIRKDITKYLNYQNQSDNFFRIFVVGGSLGARLFADVIPKAIALLDAEIRKNLMLVQQVREEDFVEVTNKYLESEIKSEVKLFFENIGEEYAKSDLIISRSGASTIAELLYLNKFSILVPIKNSIKNHQLLNAQTLVKKELAILMEEEKNFSPENLALEIEKIYKKHKNAKIAKKNNAPNFNAAQNIADLADKLSKT